MTGRLPASAAALAWVVLCALISAQPSGYCTTPGACVCDLYPKSCAPGGISLIGVGLSGVITVPMFAFTASFAQSVTVVNMYGNQIAGIDFGVFDSLTAVSTLHMYSNPNIQWLPPDLFAKCVALTTVQLDLQYGMSSLKCVPVRPPNMAAGNYLTPAGTRTCPATSGLCVVPGKCICDRYMAWNTTCLPGQVDVSNRGLTGALTRSMFNLTSSFTASVTNVFINNNTIQSIEAGLFDTLTSIQTLAMYNNPRLVWLPPALFMPLTALCQSSPVVLTLQLPALTCVPSPPTGCIRNAKNYQVGNLKTCPAQPPTQRATTLTTNSPTPYPRPSPAPTPGPTRSTAVLAGPRTSTSVPLIAASIDPIPASIPWDQAVKLRGRVRLLGAGDPTLTNVSWACNGVPVSQLAQRYGRALLTSTANNPVVVFPSGLFATNITTSGPQQFMAYQGAPVDCTFTVRHPRLGATSTTTSFSPMQPVSSQFMSFAVTPASGNASSTPFVLQVKYLLETGQRCVRFFAVLTSGYEVQLADTICASLNSPATLTTVLPSGDASNAHTLSLIAKQVYNEDLTGQSLYAWVVSSPSVNAASPLPSQSTSASNLLSQLFSWNATSPSPRIDVVVKTITSAVSSAGMTTPANASQVVGLMQAMAYYAGAMSTSSLQAMLDTTAAALPSVTSATISFDQLRNLSNAVSAVIDANPTLLSPNAALDALGAALAVVNGATGDCLACDNVLNGTSFTLQAWTTDVFTASTASSYVCPRVSTRPCPVRVPKTLLAGLPDAHVRVRQSTSITAGIASPVTSVDLLNTSSLATIPVTNATDAILIDTAYKGPLPAGSRCVWRPGTTDAAKTGSPSWSTSGCTIVPPSGSDRALCSCTHLTQFAIQTPISTTKANAYLKPAPSSTVRKQKASPSSTVRKQRASPLVTTRTAILSSHKDRCSNCTSLPKGSELFVSPQTVSAITVGSGTVSVVGGATATISAAAEAMSMSSATSAPAVSSGSAMSAARTRGPSMWIAFDFAQHTLVTRSLSESLNLSDTTTESSSFWTFGCPVVITNLFPLERFLESVRGRVQGRSARVTTTQLRFVSEGLKVSLRNLALAAIIINLTMICAVVLVGLLGRLAFFIGPVRRRLFPDNNREYIVDFIVANSIRVQLYLFQITTVSCCVHVVSVNDESSLVLLGIGIVAILYSVVFVVASAWVIMRRSLYDPVVFNARFGPLVNDYYPDKGMFVCWKLAAKSLDAIVVATLESYTFAEIVVLFLVRIAYVGSYHYYKPVIGRVDHYLTIIASWSRVLVVLLLIGSIPGMMTDPVRVQASLALSAIQSIFIAVCFIVRALYAMQRLWSVLKTRRHGTRSEMGRPEWQLAATPADGQHYRPGSYPVQIETIAAQIPNTFDNLLT